MNRAAQDHDRMADLFTKISRAVDKNLWFLEAHLQE
jgi:DNA-binding ferritin-like protein